MITKYKIILIIFSADIDNLTVVALATSYETEISVKLRA